MVTGWENTTKPLSKEERNVILPYIVRRISYNIGEENAVKAKQIINTVNTAGFTVERKGKSKHFKLTGPRFRQIIHHIRVNNLVPNLIANHKGYYVASNREDVEKYIQSLKERRNSFEEVRRSMQRYLNESGI